MNPLMLLGWWREILIALLVAAVGVQSYRLLSAEGERDILVVEKTERERRDAMRDSQNAKNRERTDEETTAARKRAAVVVVRGDPGGTGIKPGQPFVAGGGNSPVACFDRGRLDQELAGWVERHARSISTALSAVARIGDSRFTEVAREGEGVAADYRACRAYTMNLVKGEPGAGLADALVGVPTVSMRQ